MEKKRLHYDEVETIMSRVRTFIEINGYKLWTLFDTGSRNSYITSAAVKKVKLTPNRLENKFRVSLGGKKHILKQSVLTSAIVENKPVVIKLFLIDNLGKDEDGKEIELLFGALEMQNWGICPVPDKEKLDLTHYPKEFIEFYQFLPR